MLSYTIVQWRFMIQEYRHLTTRTFHEPAHSRYTEKTTLYGPKPISFLTSFSESCGVGAYIEYEMRRPWTHKGEKKDQHVSQIPFFPNAFRQIVNRSNVCRQIPSSKSCKRNLDLCFHFWIGGDWLRETSKFRFEFTKKGFDRIAHWGIGGCVEKSQSLCPQCIRDLSRVGW